MKIIHRISFGEDERTEALVRSLGLSVKKNPLPGGHSLLSFDVDEKDAAWPAVQEYVEHHGGSDVYDTIFSQSEIRKAEWTRIIPSFQQGYPEPKQTWFHNPVAYEGYCLDFGAGYRQVAPFQIAKELRMGNHDFVCLNWTYVLFSTKNVISMLQSKEIRGLAIWNVLLQHSNVPSSVIKQVFISHILDAGLVDADELKPVACPRCGIVKYRPHRRGLMKIRRSSFHDPELEVYLTSEWFGSGHNAFREILVSNRIAGLVLDHKYKGITFKPIELI